ncbi:hypothetical protein P3342_004747 [Pyrenophora teres f. teres]|nr:hypothetical protein P3342_004747 [Pyrenophora teres f. teres]
MDEKGFMLGNTGCSKRIFTRATWKQKERTAATQHGNREWFAILACVCGDGSSLPPGIIYEGKAGIQPSLVRELQPDLQDVFVAKSTSGWTNSELGLAWLEQIFNRFTIDKARRRWRLLILDGHGSHVTSDFINFCDAHKILVAVFPPHSIHIPQPLDVVMFTPLANAYNQKLQEHLQHGHSMIGIGKGEFLSIFWAAWTQTFRRELILRSFQATRVLPMRVKAREKRFNNTTPQQLNGGSVGEQGDGNSWRQLRRILHAAVEDKSKAEFKRLEQSLHLLQVENELLHHERESLRSSLRLQSKRNNKGTTLDSQHREDYHNSSAVFWSPRKIQPAHELEVIVQQEAEQPQLQKGTEKELEVTSIRQKRLEAEEAEKERDKAKKAKPIELSARRAAKQQQRSAVTSQKSHHTHQTPREKASSKHVKKRTRRRSVVGVGSKAAAAPTTPPPPPKTTTRGRTIKIPQKFV